MVTLAKGCLSLSSELILSGAGKLHYEGNAWVMYFANDSVAGVFGAQAGKKSVPSKNQEAVTHADNEGKVCTLG